MKKRIRLLWLMALFMLIGQPLLAVFVTIDGIKYDIYNYASVNRGTCSGDVVIPESVTYNGKTYKVTDISSYAFKDCTGMTSITIPNSVTSIARSAFVGCTGLTSVTIPSGVTSIDEDAFYGCTGLTSITIPSSVTSIGNRAFSDCTGLTSIKIPSSVTSIGDRAFYGCTASVTIDNNTIVSKFLADIFGTQIKEYILGNSVTGIGRRAFKDCTGLTSITIPSSVTSIGEDAFYQCTGLKFVKIPSSVTSIGNWAFYGCIGLTSVEIPHSVTNIGIYAFYGCNNLTNVLIPASVKVIGDNAFYNVPEIIYSGAATGCPWGALSVKTEAGVEISNFEFSDDAKTVISKYVGDGGDVVIPDGVVSIGNGAFQRCTGLTSITIPSSVTSIGNKAFQSCTGLTSITIPSSVTCIGEYAFYDCTGLTSVTIPSSVTSIGTRAFYNCKGLTSIEIPEGIDSIGKDAFYRCNLQSLTLPSTIKYIGSGAFYISSLQAVTCKAVVPPSLDGYPFYNTSVFLYVPGESLEAYKTAEYWKNTQFIMSSEALEKTTSYPSYSRNSMAYYDYDGDGVMEMIGIYDKEKFGLMNDMGPIRQFTWVSEQTTTQELNAAIALRAVSPLSGGSSSSGFSVNNVNIGTPLGILNGNGMLLYGEYATSTKTRSKYYPQLTDEEWLKNKDFDGFPVDLDCDGRLDFITLATYDSEKNKTLMQQCDGTFLPVDQIVTQDESALAEKMDQWRKNNSGGGIFHQSASDALSMNFVVKGSGKKAKDVSMAYDLNGDGLPDLLANDGASALMSLDVNTYVEAEFSGTIYPCDLNGDGTPDYLLYKDNVLYSVVCLANGTTKQQQIFTNSNIKFFICRDFDHDGDVDPLAFVADGTNTYFVFLRNDGNGTFKKKEGYVEGDYTFVDCADWDADGLYEVMIAYSTYEKSQYCAHTQILKIEKNFSLTDVSEDFDESINCQMMDMGDFDNDGYTNFKLVRKPVSNSYNYWGLKDVPHVVGRYSKQTVQNTAPQKMQKPVVQLDEATGMLRITWELGQDAETSACDLTYDVRIGTEPGVGNVLFAPALADGRRRMLGDGSQGTKRQMMFNIGKHRPGTYYVSVQAIDAGGLGGAWSDEVTYENFHTAPVISSTMQRTTTADTITVVANGDYDKNTEYEWTVSEGEVLSQSSNQARVIFHRAGRQQVMLTTRRNEASYKSEPLEIIVNPFRKEDTSLELAATLDIDMDGCPDGINSNYDGYLVLNDGNGNLKRYPKSFNADMKLNSAHFIDANKDGYPDILGTDEYGINSTEPKAKFYINDGEGEFEAETKDIRLVNGTMLYISSLFDDNRMTHWIDFSNTGQLGAITGWESNDYRSHTGMWTPSDYTTFTCKELFDEDHEFTQVCDLNRDGFMDIILCYKEVNLSSYPYQGETDVTAMLGHSNGDGGFDNLEMLKYVYSFGKEDNNRVSDVTIADLNNDGWQDILLFRNGGQLLIYEGNQDMTWEETNTIDLSMYKISGFYKSARDFDNNGYLDICMGNGNGSHYAILFYNDWKFDVVDEFIYDVQYTTDPFVALKDGGYPQINGALLSATIANQAPQAPDVVSVKQDKNGMVINWSDAKDDHTPAKQMRYNISVKRKGVDGENSYVISPMNGGDSRASLVFPYEYKQSTTMTVPLRALRAGETYEVRVQAIDLWNQHSPMTEPVEITITTSGYIDAPALAATGKNVTVKYMGTSSGTNACQPSEDGTIVQQDGNTFVLAWSTPGVKSVTINGITTQIQVENPVDVSFTVSEPVYAGIPVRITFADEVATLPTKVSLYALDRPNKGWMEVIEHSTGSNTATVCFNKAGAYSIVADYEDEVLGNYYKLPIEVINAPVATISCVTVDEATGCYDISWPIDYSADFTKVEIQKEGNTYNSFSTIGQVNIAEGHFTDMSSRPSAKAERYRIILLSENGQRIESSVHKPMHVMIGQAASGGYNLMWNAYDGLTVDNYQILRGTSANDLTVIEQVAGSQQSYTDMNAPAGAVFYAVAFTPQRETSEANGLRVLKSANATTTAVRSNTISTASAGTMILATSLKIIPPTTGTLTMNDEKNSLQLSVLLLPNYSYCNKVAWSIVDGNDLLVVSTDGLVTANEKNGTGRVKVRATTIDGSNLSDEVTVSVTFKEQEPILPPQGADIADGIYYLYNPASHKYLTGANDWGTQASLGTVGVDFQIVKADDRNGVQIDSRYYLNTTDHYLGWPTLYIDQPAAVWYFIPQSNGTYLMTADNEEFLSYDGQSTILTTVEDKTDTKAQWQLLTREDIIAQMANATKGNPYNATTLIAYPDFGRSGKERCLASWTDSPAIGGLSDNWCGEKFDCTFDVSQTLTGLPTGHYRLKVQGFYREGADENYGIMPAVTIRNAGQEHLYAHLYANEKEKPLMSIFDEANSCDYGYESPLGIIPNSLSHASGFFDEGFYWHELDVNVTDGTLKIGIKKVDAVYRDWTCFDSFRLYYYGPELIEEGEPDGIIELFVSNSSSDVYTVDGRKVGVSSANHQDLPKGIYVTGRKKVVVQ